MSKRGLSKIDRDLANRRKKQQEKKDQEEPVEEEEEKFEMPKPKLTLEQTYLKEKADKDRAIKNRIFYTKLKFLVQKVHEYQGQQTAAAEILVQKKLEDE